LLEKFLLEQIQRSFGYLCANNRQNIFTVANVTWWKQMPFLLYCTPFMGIFYIHLYSPQMVETYIKYNINVKQIRKPKL